VTAKPKTSVPPHLFVMDDDVPVDHLGRGACRRCHLIGRPGDTHHTMPDIPEQAAVRERYEPGGER
jgi:hypothetical protein